MITKIISTIGPSSLNLLEKIYNSGSERFRLNLSHWDKEWHYWAVSNMKKMHNVPEIILDTKGPDVRTWIFDWEMFVKKWDELILNSSDDFVFWKEKNEIFIDYKTLYKKVEKWFRIYLDSWKIVLEVLKIEWCKIFTKVKNDWVITSKRHVNIPWIYLDLPILSDSDKEILNFCKKIWFDSIAVSFVRDKKDIEEVRKFVWNDVKIISKIECRASLENIDEIIKHSDEVMIARWDLWVEIVYFKIPKIENQILKKCVQYTTPSIVATQMLMSMTKNIIPTRAEVTDVYGAVSWWANSLMLSDETASWKHPLKAVKVMQNIIKYSEKNDELQF